MLSTGIVVAVSAVTAQTVMVRAQLGILFLIRVVVLMGTVPAHLKVVTAVLAGVTAVTAVVTAVMTSVQMATVRVISVAGMMGTMASIVRVMDLAIVGVRKILLGRQVVTDVQTGDSVINALILAFGLMMTDVCVLVE